MWMKKLLAVTIIFQKRKFILDRSININPSIEEKLCQTQR
jgi:hypothetical protein